MVFHSTQELEQKKYMLYTAIQNNIQDSVWRLEKSFLNFNHKACNALKCKSDQTTADSVSKFKAHNWNVLCKSNFMQYWA